MPQEQKCGEAAPMHGSMIEIAEIFTFLWKSLWKLRETAD